MPPRTAKALRLKHAPQGQPYVIERRRFPAMEEAAAQAAEWWASRGTVAILVLDFDGEEDSRYERTWVQRSRVPEGWPARKGPQAVLIEQPEARPASPLPTPLPKAVPAEKPARLPGSCLCCRRVPDPALPLTSPSTRLAEGCCMECGTPLGLSTGQLQRMYLAFQGKLSAAHRRRNERS